jgi:hypothetical protein
MVYLLPGIQTELFLHIYVTCNFGVHCFYTDGEIFVLAIISQKLISLHYKLFIRGFAKKKSDPVPDPYKIAKGQLTQPVRGSFHSTAVIPLKLYLKDLSF